MMTLGRQNGCCRLFGRRGGRRGNKTNKRRERVFQSQTNSSFTWDRFPVFRVTHLSVLPTAEAMTTTDSDDDDLTSQASRFSGVAYRRDAAVKRIPRTCLQDPSKARETPFSVLLFCSFRLLSPLVLPQNPDRWCICRRYAMEGAILVDWDPQILSLALAALLPGPTCAKALEVFVAFDALSVTWQNKSNDV